MASAVRSIDVSTGFIVALVAVAAMTGAGAGYHLSVPADGIVPGVTVAGVPLGGLTPLQAEFLLARHLEALMEEPVLLYFGGEGWYERPGEIGIVPDLQATIAKAYAVGRAGMLPKRILDRLIVARRGYEIPVEVNVDQALFDAWLQRVARRVERPPKDAAFVAGARGEIEVVPSEIGYRLASDDLLEPIARAVVDPYARAVRLPVSSVQPELTTAAAEALGIKRLIASFTTRFDPADVNRTANIHIAANALDGLILKPGELFSFNRRVGPRIESAGYKEAPVIIDGELVPDIGGGVCQVSTTLYSAVLLAGLRVDARAPHSIPVAYVPLGLDAAVVYGAVDFRFQNDTPGHVLVKTWIEDDRVTVALYGDGPSYASVRLESEVVEVVPAEVVRVSRPELGGGQQRIVRQGRDGFRVNVWRVTKSAEGIERRELVSRSYYPARDRVIWVGGKSAIS